MQIANQFKDMIEDNTKVIIPESPDQLVRDSAHGNLQIVKDIINKFLLALKYLKENEPGFMIVRKRQKEMIIKEKHKIIRKGN